MPDGLRSFLTWLVWQSMVWLLIWCGCGELDEQSGRGESLAVVVYDTEQGECELWRSC